MALCFSQGILSVGKSSWTARFLSALVFDRFTKILASGIPPLGATIACSARLSGFRKGIAVHRASLRRLIWKQCLLVSAVLVLFSFVRPLVGQHSSHETSHSEAEHHHDNHRDSHSADPPVAAPSPGMDLTHDWAQSITDVPAETHREPHSHGRSTEHSRSNHHDHSGPHGINPDITVIIDSFFYNDDTADGIEHFYEEMAGFGHHSHGAHEHLHGGVHDGFNLRHLELRLSGEIDPYFKGWTTAAIYEDGVELEEAVIQTTYLPWGLMLRAGKLLSNFDHLNPQHPHHWDFVDLPLVHRLFFGTHGLNEIGLQLSRRVEGPCFLHLGAELFQGENEMMFNYIGGEHLPKKKGPRLGVGWLRFGPNLSPRHSLVGGLFCGYGLNEEAHDGNSDEDEDHWLQGDGSFHGTELVYEYDSPGAEGHGDFSFTAEYLRRDGSLEVMDHDLQPVLIGSQKVSVQDGYWLQAIYGFRPRWRAGLRWEQLGLTNRARLPDGSRFAYAPSYRIAWVTDYRPSDASRLRFQFARGEYELENGREGAWEFFFQLTAEFGARCTHGL